MNMAANVHYLFDFIGRTLFACLQVVCPVAAMLDLKGVSFDRLAPIYNRLALVCNECVMNK